MNTAPEVAEALTAAGFVALDRSPQDWWEGYADGIVVARVVVTAEDGVAVYAFTGGRAMLLAWSAEFSSSTPLTVLRPMFEVLGGWVLAAEITASR